MVAGGTCWIGKWEIGEGEEVQYSVSLYYLLINCHVGMVANRFHG